MNAGLRRALQEIADGPQGRRVGAFFDFDGTLIAGYSATAFAADQVRRRQVSLPFVADLVRKRVEVSLQRAQDADLVRAAIRSFAGATEAQLDELGEDLFERSIAGNVHPEARELVRAHQRAGHTVVIASSATRFQVAPLARDLGIEHVLTTRLQVRRGRLTGEVLGELLWGQGKADAVVGFARRRRIGLADSYAYGNGNEDVPYLQAVGRPRPVNPAPALERMAIDRRWPVMRFRTRRPIDLELVARNAAGIYGIAAATAAGLGVGLLLNRDRRLAANMITRLATELTLPLAGVKVSVTGEKNLWAARPAVFVFNHQSYLDGLVLGHLLRQDFTAVAKKELQALPGFNVVGWLGDFAYVDRANGRQAREVLQPVVDRLRRGTSVVIAPEGTRSTTHAVGRFKKGAFHVAMQAGVPIVPVVLRNTGDLLWKRSLVIRPGTVEVAVLPPVDTSDWKPSDLDARVAEVRDLFVRTLAGWPGPPPG